MPLILVVTANSETSPLKLAAEVRLIRGVLGEGTNFSVVHESEIRGEDLIRRLLEDRPDILHFAGHGAGVGESALSVKNDGGLRAEISETDLSRIFKSIKVRPAVAVLNACYSDELSGALSQWVKVVVGVAGAIGDLVALRFAAQFYQAISHSLSLGDAVELARAELGVNGYDPDLIQTRAREAKDLTLSFPARPELMARFNLGPNGEPTTEDDHFDVILWMRGVDQHINSVTFQICHDSYKKKDRFWEVYRSESPDFCTDDFTTTGELTIRATAWSRDRGWGTESSVSAALRRHYGDQPTPAIAEALKTLASR